MPAKKPMTVRELIERLSRDHIDPDSPVEVMRVTIAADGGIESETFPIHDVGFHDEDDHVTVEIGDPIAGWAGDPPARPGWRKVPPLF